MSDNPKITISDPTCDHADRGFVSWPPIEQITVDVTHASTLCCARQDCIDDASAWVEAHTGHAGVWQPYSDEQRTRAAAMRKALQERTLR